VALLDESDQYMSKLATALRTLHSALDVHADVEVGYNPASVIIDTVKRFKGDLVAMATHGRGLSRLVAASVADKVVRGGPGAVLLVRTSLTSARSLPDYAAQRTA
jgi:nucleotide-binding universal stress UspA family protein